MALSVRLLELKYKCVRPNDCLDSSAQIVEAIWPLSSIVCRTEMGAKGVLPLRTFIQETLRRSRTSYSTLQVALYYLILIKSHIPQHDFTMEQPEDDNCVRALQCGRRMFLAALILASKYLQDRNYSARAWSKICGLNTVEINQNETAFLLAVNWKLHITEAVFQKWSDIMLRFTSNKPGGPGAIRSCSDAATWKAIVVQLTPELDNMDYILASPSAQARPCKPTSCSANSAFFGRGISYESRSKESTPTPATYAPQVLEPALSVPYSGSQMAPALGLMPTPRLTPQSSGYSTPAVGAASYMLGRSAMGLAMSQASFVTAAQSTERWQNSVSPQGFSLARRSSLAMSVSSMSSPESMVSDNSSRSSRSSSISSASSVVSAPVSSKLDVQARCRYAKQCSERSSSTAIATVHENYSDAVHTLSPELYADPVGKDLLDMSLSTPAAPTWTEDYFSRSEANDAARALQELHNNPRSSGCSPANRAGSKRSRPASIERSLQGNVRDILNSSYASQISQGGWSDNLLRQRNVNTTAISNENAAGIVLPVSRGTDGRKRACCSTEFAAEFHQPTLLARPVMWARILN